MEHSDYMEFFNNHGTINAGSGLTLPSGNGSNSFTQSIANASPVGGVNGFGDGGGDGGGDGAGHGGGDGAGYGRGDGAGYGGGDGAGYGGGDHHGFGGNITPQGYGFTLSNGQVTGMTHVEGNWITPVNLPSTATFAVNTTANTVTETIVGSTSTEVIQYSPEANSSSLYQVTQDTTTWSNPSTTTASGYTKGVAFTLNAGQVTGMQEVFSGANFTSTENQTLSPTSTFTVNGSTITETSIHGHTIESTTYTQPTGSTLYAVAAESTTTIQPGTATTLLAVNPEDRVNFTFGTNGAVTQIQELFANGSSATITPSSQVSFNSISPGFVQETFTNGTNSSYALFYQGSSTGPYTEIAHGSGSTVDLVGIKAQLAEIPTSLLSLI